MIFLCGPLFLSILLQLTECYNISGGENHLNYSFPNDFLFGVGSSAFQIEGAWKSDGKGESIWDRLTHTNKTFVRDRSNADVAADSYHNYKRDIQMVRELGVQVYRFSISWPRILPTGLVSDINEKGLNYYKNVIDECLRYRITPMVTIYHWDLPQSLQNIGGWSNPLIVKYFTDYAKILFDNFADKVKWWVTINEPMQVCLGGYGGWYRAPSLQISGIAEYLCSHYLLKAHAAVYNLYETDYRPHYGGKMGISLDSNWAMPKTNSDTDKSAAELYLRTHVGWFAHPIFSSEGNYPPELIERVDSKSEQQNYSRSRLPKFTDDEVNYIKGTADFFGLNHYTSYLLSMAAGDVGVIPSHENDVGVLKDQNPDWPGRSPSGWLKTVPIGFRNMLNWINMTYPGVPIIVTENGYADVDGIEDNRRISYYQHYLNALLHAINEDKCNVIGYIAWSLMDNFEWDQGYVSRFGLYSVDFESQAKTRTPKKSAGVFSKVVCRRRLDSNFQPDDFSDFSSATTYVPITVTVLFMYILSMIVS